MYIYTYIIYYTIQYLHFCKQLLGELHQLHFLAGPGYLITLHVVMQSMNIKIEMGYNGATIEKDTIYIF